MTIFEFLTVAVSIVLALGLSKLISSIPFVFDGRKRDWLHILIFVLAVLAHIVVWWRIWLLNDVTDWNILQFTLLMGSPLSLYLAATALVSSTPEQVSDWKTYLADQSRWVFSASAAVIGFGLLRSYFILGTTPAWWSFLAFAVFVGAAISKLRVVHIVVILMSFSYLGLLLSRNFVAA
jgi:hypothetical protein